MSVSSRFQNRARQDASRDVVERARSGDQVAMGILAMVRDNAKKGDPRAQQSLRSLEKYISKNPPIAIGTEASDITSPHATQATAALWKPDVSNDTIIKALPLVGFWPGAVALSHGANLDSARLDAISTTMPEDNRAAFKGGVLYWQKKTPDLTDERGWLLGRIIGLARCIQLIRLPHVPIATFCPITAWELGE